MMAKFIPRSVGRGEESHDRGGPNQPYQHRGRGMSWGRGRGGFSDRGNRGGYNNFRGRGQRGHFRGRGSFIPSDKKGPVSIIYPDDPRHPDFDKDPRNAGLKARGRGKVRNADLRRSDDEDSPERHGEDERMRTEEDDMTNISEEGLRITVENKASSMTVADPSFYDEIQPRQAPNSAGSDSAAGPQSSSKEKEKTGVQSSSQPKKQSKGKKSGKESIRITVGNDRFTDDSQDIRPSSSPAGDEKQETPPDRQSTDRARSESVNKNEGKQHIRDSNQSRPPPNPRGQSPNRGRSPNRPQRSRSRSRDRRRSRSRSRGRFCRSRSTSRGRYGRRRSRSRSRGRDNFQDRRRRGPYRSGSRDRLGSRSPKGGRRRRSKSHSPGWRPKRSRSRSRGRRSYSRGRSYSRSHSRSRRSSFSPPRRGSRSPGRGRDWSGDRLSLVSDTSLNINREPHGPGGEKGNDNFRQKTKDNPFMEFLKDFPKPGDHPPADRASKVQDPSRTPPWLKDTSKASNIMEIEKYLESKLKEARGGYETKQEAQHQTQQLPPQYGREPKQMAPSNQPKPPQQPVQTTSPGWHEVTQPARNPEHFDRPPPQSRKETKPFEIYDDISKIEETARLSSPPPLESRPVKSILKNKRPDSQKQSEAPVTKSRDQTPHSDTCSITDMGPNQRLEVPLPGMASLMNIEDEDEFLYGDTPEPTVQAAIPPKREKPAVPAEIGDKLDSVYLGGYGGNKTDPGWEVAEPAQSFSSDAENMEQSSTNLEEPKTESEKLSADPTIQNILKSIGFNFELSKLMQEKAEKSRKKEEDPESYGIKQGSSFLGGGVPGADMQSVLGAASSSPEPTDRKQKEVRKPIVDRKESYEERARRYREEQQQQQNPSYSGDNYGSAGFPPEQSYQDTNYPEDQQGYYDDMYHQQNYDSYDNQGLSYDYDNGSGPVTQSNLTAVQSANNTYGQGGPMDQGPSRSALGSINQYDEHDRYGHDERMYHETSEDYESRPHSDIRDYDRRRDQLPSRDIQDRAPSYDRVDQQKQESKTLFPIIREKSPPRSKSPPPEQRSGSGSSRRTVLAPRREARESPVKETRRSEAKSAAKAEDYGKKTVKRVTTMSTKEREELVQEINERAKRLKILDKELSRLRKQENELMRKKQRQKDGHKDQLLEQNAQLQQEIGQQIKVLRRAAEVNARLLAASRRDDEADIDFLALIKEPSEKKPSLKRSPSPSPKSTMKKEPKESSDSKDRGDERRLMRMKFEYFDPGNHWCRQCNHVSTNAYEFFGHLQSKKHLTKLDPYDRPWIIAQKDKPKEPPGQSVAAAFKGVEFIMSTQAFYCSLCKSFSGDMTCAEEHVKSSEHNEKYQEYVDENSFYERRYQLDKAAGLSMTSVAKETHSDEERDHDTEKPNTKPRRQSEREDSRPKEEPHYKEEPRYKDEPKYKAEPKYKEESRYREEQTYREDPRSKSEERTRRSERAKRYAEFDESEEKLVRKKAKLVEEKKKVMQKKRQESDVREREEAQRREETMDSEPIEKRTISAGPKAPEQKPFGKFMWKGPLIGKAPGFRKGKAPASEPPSEKISIKLGGRLPCGGAKQAPIAAPKVIVQLQDVDDPAKDPNYVSKRIPLKKDNEDDSPEPLDIFVTVGKTRKQEGKSMPTISCDPGPIGKKALSPTVIADAFGGKADEDLREQDVDLREKTQQKRTAQGRDQSESIPIPSGTKEEEQERKLLGIERSDTVTLPVKPTQLVLPPSVRTFTPSAMAATSTNNIYNVFFGSKDSKTDSNNKGTDK